MMDWKDALASLREDLPEGEASQENEDSSAKDAASGSAKKGKLNIAYERKGRGGKSATIIYGFECDEEAIAALAARLKQKMGTGGSARGGEILLQGDVREKVKPLLRAEGYKI